MNHAVMATLVMVAASPLAAQTTEWSVGASSVLQIGAIDADSSYLLHRVTGTIRLRDGRIVILDASGVRYYSADGRFIATAARPGRGPGEYRTGQLLRAAGDTVVIWDLASRNRLIIEPTGEYVRDEPLAVELPEYPAVSFEFSELISRSAMLSWPQLPHIEGRAGELERQTTMFKTVDLESGSTAELGAYPQRIARVLASGPVRHASQPYSPETVHGVGPGGIYIGDSAGREIHVFTLSGEPKLTVTLDFEPVPVTPRDLDAARARTFSSVSPELRPLAERVWAEAPKPDVFPYFDRLIGESNGRVWVRQYLADPDARSEWRVLNQEGVEIGAVQLPGRFELKVVDGQHLTGVWRDELDVEYVQVWRLAEMMPEILNGPHSNGVDFLSRPPVALAVAFIAGVSATQPPLGSSSDKVLQDTIAAQEAVIRYLIANDGIDVPYYCLGLGNDVPTADPPGPLLERFSENIPPVVPASACTMARSGDLHAASGQPAQFYLLSNDLVREESGRVTVSASHHVHGRHGAMYRCVVTVVDGAWIPSCTRVRIS